MAYSAKAAERRRCRATCRNGSRCQAWAIWGHPDGLCSTHAGCTRGPRDRRRSWQVTQHAAYEPCRCRAYAWPHRPGGGWCRWPDPPSYESPTPAGTHSWPRLRWPTGGRAAVLGIGPPPPRTWSQPVDLASLVRQALASLPTETDDLAPRKGSTAPALPDRTSPKDCFPLLRRLLEDL
jgi:hypothetical protein